MIKKKDLILHNSQKLELNIIIVFLSKKTLRLQAEIFEDR